MFATSSRASSSAVAATPSRNLRAPGLVPSTVTPRSSTRTLVESVDGNIVVACVEGRGQARGEVGIACINLQTSSLILCQFTDTQSYSKVITKLNIFRPHEILMPSTCVENTGTPSQLYLQLKTEASNVNIVSIQRKVFHEGKGLMRIKQLVVDQFSPVIQIVTQRYYCLAAVSALLRYVELTHSIIFSTRSLKIQFQSSEETCMIDSVTAKNLELLQNNHQAASPHSLLGLLSNCRTPGGSRLLRMNILQPPCDLRLIQQRLDCVQEFTEKRDQLFQLQDVLSRLPVDIEHVISTLIQIPKVDNTRTMENRMNSLIALKHTLDLLPQFVIALENTEQPILLAYRQDCQSNVLENMLEEIKRVITTDTKVRTGAVSMKRQRCFAVKEYVNPLLDIARRAYCEVMQDVNGYISNLTNKLNMTFRLGQNSSGFYIQLILPRGDPIPELPKYFLKVRKNLNIVTFTTESILSMDVRLNEIEKEIESISGLVISTLVTTIRKDIACLYKVGDAIANLDILYALASYSLSTLRCVRPSFSKLATSITNGRHPVLEQISNRCSPVPNNTFLSEDTNVAIITGPNMSGKTTYLKQVATLQILSQLGSFVPADAATFRVASNIFSRLGTGDNLEDGASSFSVEMKEMNYILSNINDSSLVIIDELGRSTSVEEGTSISWTILEKLLRTKSFILFATHYLYLTKMENIYRRVLCYTMETQEWLQVDNSVVETRRLKYTHVLKRGVSDIENYGLKLAATTSYPQHIVDRAIAIAKHIGERRQNTKTDRRGQASQEYSQGLYLLGCNLKLLSDSVESMNPEDVKDYCLALQTDFLTSFKGLKSISNSYTISETLNDSSTDDEDNYSRAPYPFGTQSSEEFETTRDENSQMDADKNSLGSQSRAPTSNVNDSSGSQLFVNSQDSLVPRPNANANHQEGSNLFSNSQDIVVSTPSANVPQSSNLYTNSQDIVVSTSSANFPQSSNLYANSQDVVVSTRSAHLPQSSNLYTNSRDLEASTPNEHNSRAPSSIANIRDDSGLCVMNSHAASLNANDSNGSVSANEESAFFEINSDISL